MKQTFSLASLHTSVRRVFAKRHTYSEWHIHPSRDWGIILLSTAVCMVCVNVALFFFAENMGQSVAPEVAPAYTLDVDMIRKTAEEYRAKEERFRAVVGETSIDSHITGTAPAGSTGESTAPAKPVAD